MAAPSRIDVKASLILAALFVAVWLLWNTPIVYPIKIFVVSLHELGHALATLLTGGEVVSIQLFPDEGGVTTTRGGWPFVIVSAGYLGSMLFGGLLLLLSSRRSQARRLMLALAALLFISTLLFFRNGFAVLYGLLAAAAMFFSARRFSVNVNFTIIRFIAITSCLYALFDIRSDLFAASPPPGWRSVNDAVALSRLTGLPDGLWAVLWLALSLLMLAFFLKSSLRFQDQEQTSE